MPRRFRNAVGPTVRLLRIEKGLTQDQLAARLVLAGLVNADRVWVAKIESQIRNVFDFELAVIAAVLGVTADKLLPGGKELKGDLQALQNGGR
ncbi:MAG: helix-turn-helix transcriptional regulator [Verrucomicrobiae bacterium]|nr:helix-turn-helix transcriptional regulator [Verrucomicrobiae bacterium]